MRKISKVIETCDRFVGAILKIKRSRYEVFEYDYNLGFLIRKVSGKKENSCISVSLYQMVNGIKSGQIEILDIKEK